MQSAVVLLSALLAVIISAPTASMAQKNVIGEKTLVLSRQCAKDNNLPDERSILAFSQELPQNEAERCFLECCYRGLGLIEGNAFSQAGGMNVIKLRFQKPEEIALSTKLVDTCVKEVKFTEGEKCSLGRSVRECFVTNGKEVDFFPQAL